MGGNILDKQTEKLAVDIATVLLDKKAQEVEVYYVGDITSFAQYFVIASGTSVTHIKALTDEVEEKMAEQGITMGHKEGYRTANWILLNYHDVVVHVFHPEARSFYNLERLWSDALRVELAERKIDA